MVDDDKIKQAVKLFLEAINEDPDREGLKDTPQRIANMCHEIFCTPKDNLDKTFSCESENMVIEKNICFYSICEHHLLPFFGQAHIAYIPDGKVIGLSKLARCVEICSKKLQLQERLTNEILFKLEKHLGKNKGIIVMLEAEHICVSMRGIKKTGAKTITYASKGIFESDNILIERFFSAVKND